MAGTAGIVGGSIAAAVTIRKEFKQDIGKVDEIKALNEELAGVLSGTVRTPEKLPASFREKLPSELPIWGKLNGLEESAKAAQRGPHLSAIAKVKQVYHAAERRILQANGYRSTGWRGLTLGTYDCMRQMSAESRNAIFLNSIVTMGAIAGAAYMYFTNKGTSRRTASTEAKTDHISTAMDELLQRLDAQEAARTSGRG